MRWINAPRVRVTSLFRRERLEGQLDAELQFHVEQQTEESLRAGMSPEVARLAALRATGSVTLSKEQCRESLGLRLLDDLRHDLHYARIDADHSLRLRGSRASLGG
jgi:macrolide transport system ATP-binding/permease protein